MTTYDESTAGERIDVAAEFVTRRVLRCSDRRVHRLLVDDTSGERFAVLVPPGADPLYDLRTGGSYRFCGLRYVDPSTVASADVAGGPDRDGSGSEPRADALAVAVEELGLEEPFGVVDGETTVERDRPDER